MATVRRLSDSDVKTIFDCVHNNRPPPQKLSFQLVVVGPNGLKLSPPSFEFSGECAPNEAAATPLARPFRISRRVFDSFRLNAHPPPWSLTNAAARRRTVRPAEAAEEAQEAGRRRISRSAQDSLESGQPGHARRSPVPLPLEPQRAAVPTADRHPAAVLLPQGGSRLQQQEGWGAMDNGETGGGYSTQMSVSESLVPFANDVSTVHRRPSLEDASTVTKI